MASTGQVDPIFVTVADTAKILAISTEDVDELLRAGRIRWCRQAGRISVSLKSLRKYAADLISESA